eukprot:18520_1
MTTSSHKAGICDLSFHPSSNSDDIVLLSCGSDGELHKLSGAQLSITDVKPEAFQNTQALHSIAFSFTGKRFATGGADARVVLFSYPECSFERLITRLQSPVNQVAFDHSGRWLAVAGDDSTVKVVDVDNIERIVLLCGHDGPVRAASFQGKTKPGSQLANEGDSDLEGEATKPKTESSGRVLATIGSDCALRLWSVGSTTGRCLHVIPKLFSRALLNSRDSIIRLSWHPEGTYLAIPGTQNVRVLKAGTWETLYELEGEHNAEITNVAWHPSGRFLASTCTARKIVIWDVRTRRALVREFVDARVSSMMWQSNTETRTLAYILSDGFIHCWNEAIPEADPTPAPTPAIPAGDDDSDEDIIINRSKRKSLGGGSEKVRTPAVPTPRSRLKHLKKKVPKSPDDDSSTERKSEDKSSAQALHAHSKNRKEEKPVKINAFIDDVAMDDDVMSTGGSEIGSKKYEDSSSEAARLALAVTADDGDLLGSAPHSGILDKSLNDLKAESREVAARMSEYGPLIAEATPMQQPFQPGSTPTQDDRKLLAWNEIGSISVRSEYSQAIVDIEFSDHSRRRPGRILGQHNYELGAIGSVGAVLASPSEFGGHGQLAMCAHIYYRPFDSWAPNAHWEYDLPKSEEPTCVAIGTKWVAVATSHAHVRVFSFAGTQSVILQFPGPVVTMAGRDRMLAVVYHKGTPWSGNQNLGVKVFDMEAEKKIHEGGFPLTNGAELRWLHFTEHYVLVSYDDAGHLRSLASSWGFEWVPLFDTSTCVAKDDALWPLFIHGSKLMAAVCKGSKYPQVNPLPHVTPFQLQIPLLGLKPRKAPGEKHVADEAKSQLSGTAQAEEEHLRGTLFYEEAMNWSKFLAKREFDQFTNKIAVKHRAHLDKTRASQFHHLCSSNPVKALDLAQALKTKAAFQFCINAASQQGQTLLAEKVQMLCQRKFMKLSTPASLNRPAPRSVNRRPVQSRPTPPVRPSADIAKSASKRLSVKSSNGSAKSCNTTGSAKKDTRRNIDASGGFLTPVGQKRKADESAHPDKIVEDDKPEAPAVVKTPTNPFAVKNPSSDNSSTKKQRTSVFGVRN